MKVLFFLFLIGCGEAKMTKITKYGIDYIGGAKYQDLILAYHPDGWSAGFLSYDHGFGDALPMIWLLAQQKKEIPVIKIHLKWADDHNYDKLIYEIKAEAERVALLTEQFPFQRFEISPALEHTFNQKQIELMFKVLESVFPDENVILLNTPCCGGELSETYKNEIHNQDPIELDYNFSFDGRDVFEMPLHEVRAEIKRQERAQQIYLWTPSLNGKINVEDDRPRAERRNWPTYETIQDLVALVGAK